MIKERTDTITITIIDYYCDICGKKIDNSYLIEDDERLMAYTTHYAEIQHYHLGYEDMRMHYMFDICPECMRKKVFPLVEKTFNIKPRIDD